MQETGAELDPSMENAVGEMLSVLYGARAPEALTGIREVIARHAPALSKLKYGPWGAEDVALITYGDMVRDAGRPTLDVLREFLVGAGLDDAFSVVHLLPIFPYSSDDGFSVIDYRRLQTELGDWDQVRSLGRHFDLALDLVLNHCSKESDWFKRYLAGDEPYTRYFVEADPSEDLSAVVRPRSLPLLTPFETSRGERHVWTTFSDDQVDLNFAEPAVLAEMIDILLQYVANGARVIRLDAIAFLWKRIGTPSLHLPETHLVVKLMRRIVESLAPGVALLSETNVPHSENISYFGDGDEAHMVYQFSLPPLLIDAFARRDAGPLSRWLAALEPAPEGTAFFNFTASHDGIGVRPLEEQVPPERVAQLAEHVRSLGGHVSTRRLPDGSDKPYELNVTYVDAVGDPDSSDDERVGRFLASQAIMLAQRGVPGVYFHSLVGTRNDHAGVEATGRARSINRHKYELGELRSAIGDTTSSQGRIFEGYRRLLQLRRAQAAFHPAGAQRAVDTGDSQLAAFERRAPDDSRGLVCVANFGTTPQRVDVEGWTGRATGTDLLAPDASAAGDGLTVAPFRVAWIETD